MASRYHTKIIDLSDSAALEAEAARYRKLARTFKAQIESIYRKISREIDMYYFQKMQHDLMVEPPERDRSKKVDWTSDKQRAYVMMMWRKHRIKLPTERAQQIINNYKIDAVPNKKGIDFNIRNTIRNHIFVVGRLGISKRPSDIRKYEIPIQKFHLTTGWTPAHRTISPYVDEARRYAKKRTMEEVRLLIDGTSKFRSQKTSQT